MTRLVDVYAYRKEQSGVKLLILKRAPDIIYSGQWRMIGGKVQGDEKAFEAGIRELKEETKLQAQTFWALPSVNHFYDAKADTIRQIPAFAAEIDVSRGLKLNHEHSDWKWISEDEIPAYIYWPEQKRLMRLLISIITGNKLLSEWIIKN